MTEIVKERPQPWSFTHEMVQIAWPVQKLLDIRPVENAPTSLWIALTVDGILLRLDLSHVSSQVIARVPEEKMAWIAEEVSAHFPHQEKLVLAPGGRFAAIINRWGRHGAVLDLSSGQIVMNLERGAYHALAIVIFLSPWLRETITLCSCMGQTGIASISLIW